jgi:hypothetical protein
MIVQVTHARDEIILLKQLLPIWSKYVDGFVFFLDETTDGSLEYLNSVKEKFNILDIVDHKRDNSDFIKLETDERQYSFDIAKKYTNLIICLDADEYLDGNWSKKELNSFLENNLNCSFWLEWIQYTDKNKIRVDGKWKEHYVDRMGNYSQSNSLRFERRSMHSSHLPQCIRKIFVNKNDLFVSHLQWLDKYSVGIKQYYWKTVEKVNEIKFDEYVCESKDYDDSVNNFVWTEIDAPKALQVDSDIFKPIKNSTNYRLKFILDMTELYSIENLGDWNLSFLTDPSMYFCMNVNRDNINAAISILKEITKECSHNIESIKIFCEGVDNKKNILLKIPEVELYDKSSREDAVKKSLETCPYVMCLTEKSKASSVKLMFKYIVQNNMKSNIKI